MKLRPLGDRVILQYQETEEKTQSGIIMPDSAKEKTAGNCCGSSRGR